MKYRYVVVDDIQKEEPKIFKGFISALRAAKKLPKSYIYEYKWDPAESSSKDHWRCIWNWADQWDDDTAIGLVLQRQYKEVANDADQIDDNHASDAFEDMVREDFELNIKKTPDEVEINTSGDEAGEIFDFARAILGDNFEAFDQDFPDPVENEVTDLAPAEFDYDFDEDQLDVDYDVDSDQAFSDIEFKGPRTEDEIENDEISSDDEDEEEVTDIEPASQPDDDEIVEPKDIVPAAEKALMDTIEKTPADESPKDMINGKLVDAKNPTEAEVEVEEDYTGTPEERTTHLEYTDDDVTDGKIKLPKNITKSEDDHCKKINKGINHDIDPKEKALLEANFSADAKDMSEFLDKYYKIEDPASLGLQEWLDADWGTKVELADQLLDKLVAECGETDADDADGYWVDDNETWCNRYLYYDPFKNPTKIEKLCNKYSARYPGLNFYCKYDDDVQDSDDIEYDDNDYWDDRTPGEIGYNLWEAYAGEEDAYSNP